MGRRPQRVLDLGLIEFISTYGVWLVAAMIALETIGAPLPAEAALMAAAAFAANTGELDLRLLLIAGTVAAIAGNVVGYWLGRRFGHQLLANYGSRVGLTPERLRIGQWLFERYGGVFVFVARFLPFLRNLAAVLAGANNMPPHKFYLASSAAAAIWAIGYGLAAYSLGEAFTTRASPAAGVLALVAVAILVSVPMLIVRNENRLLAKIAREEAAAPRAPSRR
jgi:membrane protein DedA with SNARE-associated domain